MATLVSVSVVLGLVSVRWPTGLPLPTGLSMPLLLGGLLLPAWVIRTLIGVAAAMVVLAAVVVWPRVTQPPAASLLTLGAAAVVAGELARRRERLGGGDEPRPDSLALHDGCDDECHGQRRGLDPTLADERRGMLDGVVRGRH